ncbi:MULTISPECIES: DUF378 domain-containing protein [Clostridium]|uniref:DUF378 domain-containing protein n=1 Tax=Clostridium aquiflavi TaxID=3073603 RepID=A0ABU1EJ10_9CLOT|nr:MULTISPECIES: DUF378 domain-containing protein [unclassified Clostridium]MDR5588381.1 DUF378 domain-containing protein [Clostridium sp. 5N-1]NFG62244.1 DUF378 domain-containing protein [Clostridium botulinum]NFQ09719.1 DUF378 domain-containing protein [Clostridium botulinum]
MKAFDYIALISVVISAINWGLIGFFQINIVAILLGCYIIFGKIIYSLIRMAEIYSLSFFTKERTIA